MSPLSPEDEQAGLPVADVCDCGRDLGDYAGPVDYARRDDLIAVTACAYCTPDIAPGFFE